jgi:hypothetical protein
MKRIVVIAVVGVILAAANPAAAYRILDRDKARGSDIAVAKARSRGVGSIGYAISPLDGKETLVYYWNTHCGNGWSRSKSGSVTLAKGRTKTWIIHPPERPRCDHFLEGWLKDSTGGTVSIVISAR